MMKIFHLQINVELYNLIGLICCLAYSGPEGVTRLGSMSLKDRYAAIVQKYNHVIDTLPLNTWFMHHLFNYTGEFLYLLYKAYLFYYALDLLALLKIIVINNLFSIHIM